MLPRLSYLIFSVGVAVSACGAKADKVSLQDGRQLEGRFSRLNAMLADPNAPGAETKPILMCDNDLSYTYVPAKSSNITAVEATPADQQLEQIDIEQNVATSGARIGSIGAILQVTPFDDHGHRRLTVAGGPAGVLNIFEGISKITPKWTRVQGMQVKLPTYILDQRVATSSIPSDTLSKILHHQIDPNDVDQRLKVVRLYLEDERYRDAEEELKPIIAQFPNRKGLDKVRHDLKQMGARQIVQEIDTRRKAGQHQFAYRLLEKFPTDEIDGDILQQVRAKLDEYNELKKEGEGIVAKLKELAAALPPNGLQNRVQPIITEVTSELSVGTLDRMATYQRFVGNPDAKPDTLLALAISGWLGGAGKATENLQIAISMAELRDSLRDYLKEDVKLKRDALETSIRGQEAATPELIAALADHMKPPVDTEQQDEPGFYCLQVPSMPEEKPVTYYVQLPPEYDPHVRYPCVVTLHGAGTNAEQQISWWAGDFIDRGGQKIRGGQAARHGYIVIAPVWTVDHQKEFEGTAREHDAVLSVLRNACRRFAIDTDRVFLSGHSAGATAAWEIGLAHPDLWAGVIPIVPTLNKTIQLYWKNAERVPLYFVCGEMDGDKFVKNAAEFDRYLGSSKAGAFDCTVVEFRGRGHEHFSDEIQHIFDWMGRKQRTFYPRDFTTSTQRSFDNFFWWIELRDFQPGPRPMQIEAKMTASNGVMVSAGGNVTVWLSPEMRLDFGRPIAITLNGHPMVSPNKIQPDLAVLLEDLRTRADRRHPFWAKVE